MTSVSEQIEIRIKGKDTLVPSLRIDGRSVIVTGKWLKTASVHDEFFVQGKIVSDPEPFIRELSRWELKPDLFAFPEKITDPNPRFKYAVQWEGFAVIRITTYENWFKNQIKKDVRENLNRAKREGVVVRAVQYDDTFVQGIKELCDETPIRQGTRFWHHGKSERTFVTLRGFDDIVGNDGLSYTGALQGDCFRDLKIIGPIK